jgi:hypothetical protein
MGSNKTGSIRAMEGYNQSRKDDLESLGYTYMLLLDSERVPWNGDLTLETTILLKKKSFVAQH